MRGDKSKMKKMKSWRFHEFGHIKNLKLEEIDIPEPAPDEALIKVEYTSLNPADKFLVMGRYVGAGKPPFAVGRGGCGTVVIPGASGRFKTGDRLLLLRSDVGITREGSLAQYVTVPEACLAPLPKGWTSQDGAAGPLVLLTSWQALSLAAHLKAGERVVITGASGGVGISSLLLAKALGAETVALSRDRKKQERLLSMGADHAFSTDDEDLVSKVKAIGGADVIIENICGDFLAKSLKMVNLFGRICIIGALGGINSMIDPLDIIFKRVQVHGIQVSMFAEDNIQDVWADLCRVLEPTEGKVLIDKIFPFDQVQEAFEHMRHGPMGKVVIGPMP